MPTDKDDFPRRIVEVSETIDIKASPATVWNKICEPCSLKEWHDDVDTCERSHDDKGRLARNYVMKPNGDHKPVTMYEVELLRSPEIMTIAYIVDVRGLPVENYHAQITVTPVDDDACQARIRSIFVGVDWGVPALEPGRVVSEFYKRGLTKLRAITEAA